MGMTPCAKDVYKRQEDNFVQKLVGCFAPDQTTEELVVNVNAVFGTNIDPEEFERILATTALSLIHILFSWLEDLISSIASSIGGVFEGIGDTIINAIWDNLMTVSYTHLWQELPTTCMREPLAPAA